MVLCKIDEIKFSENHKMPFDPVAKVKCLFYNPDDEEYIKSGITLEIAMRRCKDFINQHVNVDHISPDLDPSKWMGKIIDVYFDDKNNGYLDFEVVDTDFAEYIKNNAPDVSAEWIVYQEDGITVDAQPRGITVCENMIARMKGARVIDAIAMGIYKQNQSNEFNQSRPPNKTNIADKTNNVIQKNSKQNSNTFNQFSSVLKNKDKFNNLSPHSFPFATGKTNYDSGGKMSDFQTDLNKLKATYGVTVYTQQEVDNIIDTKVNKKFADKKEELKNDIEGNFLNNLLKNEEIKNKLEKYGINEKEIKADNFAKFIDDIENGKIKELKEEIEFKNKVEEVSERFGINKDEFKDCKTVKDVFGILAKAEPTNLNKNVLGASFGSNNDKVNNFSRFE
ncbi:hypothetical protein J3E07_001578 [Methanococcus voltae]|uniref:Uncharacterized protein n=1 Tax=Methanococcus voltae TaxID=2188 RepID=A0A8J7UT15_METVO|nr:hypothetical protein [Methanococcus voltae]MBP2202137.1 hypothetical protein [Methanococcus voltae]